MEDHAHLPQPPPPPAAPPGMRPIGSGPKRKVQRRLGLPLPPAVAGNASVTAQGSTATTEGGAAATLPRKRPPRDPSLAPSVRKVPRTSATPPPLVSAAPLPHLSPLPPSTSLTSPLTAATPPPVVLTGVSVDAQQVLDEMPESVDDESFLNMMDEESFGFHINSTLEIDEDIGSDAEGETVQPKKKGSRGVNFTTAEDETVVKAWQAISLDAITGDEQNGSTYWNRIYDHFQRNNKSGIFRSQVSVTHRWQTISTSCSMWVSCLEKVERLNPSGANSQDKVNIAQQLYKGRPKKKGGKPGKAFALHHCWALLQQDEKWRTRDDEVPTKSKKSSNSYSLGNDDHVDFYNSDDEDSDGRRSPTPSSAVPSTKRPPGRKTEKEKLKKGGDTTYKESMDNMMLSRKELTAERMEFKTSRWMELKEMEDRRAAAEERRAAAEERRAAAEERRVAAEEMAKRLEQEQRIMFMDPTNLDEKGRAYFELLRDQVLAARAMGGFYMGGVIGGIGTNGGFGANGSSNIGGNESCTHVGGNGSE